MDALGGLGLNGPGLSLPEDGSEADGRPAEQTPSRSPLRPDVTQPHFDVGSGCDSCGRHQSCPSLARINTLGNPLGDAQVLAGRESPASCLVVKADLQQQVCRSFYQARKCCAWRKNTWVEANGMNL